MGGQKFIRLIKGVNGYYSADTAPHLNPNELQYDEILVYDSTTKVVYYKFVEFLAKDNPDHVLGLPGHLERIGYLSPYISENGKYCRYNGALGRIEEIG